MRTYSLQRFRGGWAIVTHDGGARVSRRKLPASDPAAAVRLFDRLVAELRRPEPQSVAAIWDAYAAAMAGRPIAVTMGFERKAVLAHFGAMDPERIEDKDCDAYMAARSASGRRPGTVWTELGHLRTALRWAERQRLIARAPAIKRPVKPDPRTRYLTRDEAGRLLAAASMPHIRLFIILAIATAGRRAALLELTWDRVDLEAGTIRLSSDELGARRKGRATVPVNDMARAALAEARAGARTGHVIEWAGAPVRSVRRGIDAAARRAGLAGVTPHVFRHTAAVWMLQAGRPMSEIAQFLGHADSRITERVYARFSPDHLRTAARALEFDALRSVR